jgi:predicted transcriptional regulator
MQGTEKFNLNSGKDNQRALSVAKVADMWGVSARYVYMVIRGDREHEGIFESYMEMTEGVDRLVAEVNRLVPFNEKKAS